MSENLNRKISEIKEAISTEKDIFKIRRLELELSFLIKKNKKVRLDN